jgi:hypothetical protein
MKTSAIGAALIVAGVVGRFAGAAATDVIVPEQHRGFLATHCYACHDAAVQEGNVNLEALPLQIDTVEQAERWQKVLRVVNSGEMPPEGEPRPDPAAKTDFLSDLAEAMVVARKALADAGGTITLRRLNRREYRNTIKQLLGFTVRAEQLPDDASPGSFDTVGSSLFLSSDQFEEYFRLARAAIDEWFLRHADQATPAVFRLEPETVTNPEDEKMVQRFEDNRERFLRWKVGVDQAAAAPENEAVMADIRAKDPNVVKMPHIFLYYHAEQLSGCPNPKEYGFSDASHAAFDGNQNNVLLYPFYRHYFDLPGREAGTYLKLPHHGATFHSRIDIEPTPPLRPGRYTLRLRAGAVEAAPAFRKFIEVGYPRRQDNPHLRRGLEGAPLVTLQVRGTVERPEVVETQIDVSSSDINALAIQERQPSDCAAFFKAWFHREKHANGYGYEPALWVDWIELEGPLPESSPSSIWSQVFDGLPTRAPEEIRAKTILRRFGKLAFRGAAPSGEFLDRLLKVYQAERRAGAPPTEAIRKPLAVVLASPSFLYLFEPGVDDSPRTLDDRELAVRLAFFLWSSPPDEQLLRLAERKELHLPEVLRAEVDRMIEDTRSDEFVAGFLHQWLDMKRLDFFQFDVFRHREFDESTRAAARQEVYESFAHLLRDPRHGRLGQLLKSDYVVINGLLATYYGIDGVNGESFRKVAVPPDAPRGGLLGMAAIHAMGSNGIESSPVERGAWVLRHLLHDPPPPAPPNVPQLSRLADKPLTTRERLAAHREEPQCASCHRKIDPIGFGLENFDAAGKWRTTERLGPKTWTIEPADAFFQGPSFQNFFELRDLIAAREDDFARGFTEHLIEYALGRPCGFTDHELVEQIVATARDQQYAVRAFVRAIVQSDQFRTK